MDRLRDDYINFREKIFCQEISSSQMKQFSDRVKAQIVQVSNEREPFSIIQLLLEMCSHNISIKQGAAPEQDSVRMFDVHLSLNQLQSLKRCIGKLYEPEKILKAFELLFCLLCSEPILPKASSAFFMHCKTINDLLYHLSAILKIKNHDYLIQALHLIEQLLKYENKYQSTMILDHIQAQSIHILIKGLSIDQDVMNKSSQILQMYFSSF